MFFGTHFFFLYILNSHILSLWPVGLISIQTHTCFKFLLLYTWALTVQCILMWLVLLTMILYIFHLQLIMFHQSCFSFLLFNCNWRTHKNADLRLTYFFSISFEWFLLTVTLLDKHYQNKTNPERKCNT